MIQGLPARVIEIISGELATQFNAVSAGHCVRIDDVADRDVEALVNAVKLRLPGFDVWSLEPASKSGLSISIDQAVELRNRKKRPLMLLVSSGRADAASSLDNSFERVPMSSLLGATADALEAELESSEVAEVITAIRQLRRKSYSSEAWVNFLAALLEDSTFENAGRQLWQVGLLPDAGTSSIAERIADNARVVQAISAPSRPSSTISERLTLAGVAESPERQQVTRLLEDGDLPLSLQGEWCRRLVDLAPQLTFDAWLLANASESELASLTIKPFRKPDGSLDTACKLSIDSDGQLSCEVSDDSPGVIAISLITSPSAVSSVKSWRLELVPPADLRSAATEPLQTMQVAGSKKKASFKVDVTEDDLANGRRFVVRCLALGAFGEVLQLATGDEASAESDEFDLIWTDEPLPREPRASTANSAAEAILEGVVRDGLDEIEEEYSFDREGAVMRIRLDRRIQKNVRISPVITEIQERQLASPGDHRRFLIERSGTAVDELRIQAAALELPKTLSERRSSLLRQFASSSPRSYVESLDWTDELRDETYTYLSTYKRALDQASGDALRDLLALDAVELPLPSFQGRLTAVVLLPTHPLRLTWISMHDAQLRAWADEAKELRTPADRQASVELPLVRRISPANLPYTILSSSGEVLSYVEEVCFGCGLYLPSEISDPDLLAEQISLTLGMDRHSPSAIVRASQAKSRADAYAKSHADRDSYRLISVNTGAGEMAATAVTAFIGDVDGDEDSPGPSARVEVIAYSDHSNYAQPLAAIQELQQALRLQDRFQKSSFLTPPLSLSNRSRDLITSDTSGAHLSLFVGIGSRSMHGSAQPSARQPALGGLLTSTETHRIDDGAAPRWETSPALLSIPGSDPDLAGAHRSHQEAVTRAIGQSGTIAASVIVDADTMSQVRALHERSDWVISVDRQLGFDLYQEAQQVGLGSSYVLDYSPDFVEGVTERLTVTTTHRSEILEILRNAMIEIGLAAVGTESMVLDDLGVVSGRLALRLLSATSQAREAVSLAALVSHLRQRGKLDGLIVIPVDAHPDLFGPTSKTDGQGPRRCDLLLVKLNRSTFQIECVEVKSRREASVTTALADRIVDQLRDTENLLLGRFFAGDPPRIDQRLQRARLSSLLHHYAERAFLNGLFEGDQMVDLHKNIDRIEESGKAAEISLRGYVVSLDGSEGFPTEHQGVPITVLTAEDLGRAGFTTLGEAAAREVESTLEAVSDASDGASPNRSRSRGESESATEGESSAASLDGESQVIRPRKAPSPEKAAPRPPRATNEPTPDSRVTADEPDEPPEVTGREEPLGVAVTLGKDASGQEVRWRISTKGSPHAFIVGIPGQGKSVTVRRIIRSFQSSDLPSLVFDFHGDMAASPPDGAVVLNATQGLPFSPFELRSASTSDVNAMALEIAEVVGYVCGLGEVQTMHVYRGLRLAYEQCGWRNGEKGSRLPSLDEFAKAVEAVEQGAKGKNARDRLRPLTDFGLFQEHPQSRFDPTGSGQGLVVDVSGIPLESVQIAATAFILRRVYRESFLWGETDRMRLAVILDEAHRLAKDRTLPRLMKEGRKYGISVVVASQSADDFHKDVVNNAGTKIAFRTNFPASKRVAGFLRGRAGQDLSSQIELLGVGEAYVSTPEVAQARKVYMFE